MPDTPEWRRTGAHGNNVSFEYGVSPTMPDTPETDPRPELVQWFHEGDEICEHDYDPPPCEVYADALLRAFTVEPRLYENKDGTFQYESHHFRRLVAYDARCEEPHDA